MEMTSSFVRSYFNDMVSRHDLSLERAASPLPQQGETDFSSFLAQFQNNDAASTSPPAPAATGLPHFTHTAQSMLLNKAASTDTGKTPPASSGNAASPGKPGVVQESPLGGGGDDNPKIPNVVNPRAPIRPDTPGETGESPGGGATSGGSSSSNPAKDDTPFDMAPNDKLRPRMPQL
jgi:hypothetical protein